MNFPKWIMVFAFFFGSYALTTSFTELWMQIVSFVCGVILIIAALTLFNFAVEEEIAKKLKEGADKK